MIVAICCANAKDNPLGFYSCRSRDDGFLYADEHDCRVYYECRLGSIIYKTCNEANLKYFNPETQQCGQNKHASCVIPEENPIGDYVCNSRDDYHSYADPNDCRIFYRCSSSQEMIYSMCDVTVPAYFNPETLACELKKPASCKTSWPLPIIPSNIENPIGDGRCGSIVGGLRYADENDCRVYYECSRHAMIYKTCNETNLEYFNQETQECEQNKTASCEIPKENPIGDNMCYSKEYNARFADTNNCRIYYKCKDNKMIYKLCDKYFNPQTLECEQNKPASCS